MSLKKRFTSIKSFLDKIMVNQNVIVYVINVMFLTTGISISLTDVNGNVLVTISESLIEASKETKKYQNYSIIKIFKILLIKASFIKNKPVAINFKNVKRYQKSFCVKILKSKVFIKSIQINVSMPHNGCRPPKLKRLKFRTKRLIIK